MNHSNQAIAVNERTAALIAVCLTGYLTVFLIICLTIMPHTAFAYGIDDMIGDKWRVGTFLFLVFGMVLYAGFVLVYMRNARGKLKRGEFIMLSTILGGVMLGFVVSFVQFVQGFLL